jgi:hypothetical protein
LFDKEVRKMPEAVNHRDAKRVASDLLLQFRVPGSRKGGTGQVRDLSHTGAQFITDQKLTLGTKIQIRISPSGGKTPSLMAPAEVVRWRAVKGMQSAAHSTELHRTAIGSRAVVRVEMIRPVPDTGP